MKEDKCPNCGRFLQFDSEKDLHFCPTCDEYFDLELLNGPITQGQLDRAASEMRFWGNF